jgi:galactokinase
MTFTVSAPGRICLFGEHQDYFRFPVLASAIDLRATIRCSTRSDTQVQLRLLDLDEQKTWDLKQLPSPAPHDHWLIALHLAQREGWLPQQGWDAEVTSEIPMQAGASSSSALLVAWCALIAHRFQAKRWDLAWIAQAAWRAEVEWFNQPGGMMDQAVCALGGTQSLSFAPEFQATHLSSPPGNWILFDSQQPKDTLGVLERAKHRRLELLEEWRAMEEWSWQSHRRRFPQHWSAEDRQLMSTTIENKIVSEQGTLEARREQPSKQRLGSLLTEHHHWLSAGIQVSTDRIDGILKSALEAGALGGKINGSGGGGTGFVLCLDQDQDRVMEAIESASGVPIPIAIGAEGVRIEASAI